MAALQPVEKSVPSFPMYVCSVVPSRAIQTFGVKSNVVSSFIRGEKFEDAVCRWMRMVGAREDRNSQ